MATSYGFHPEALFEYAEATNYYLGAASPRVADGSLQQSSPRSLPWSLLPLAGVSSKILTFGATEPSVKLTFKSKWLLIPAIVIGLLFLAALFLPVFSSVSHGSPEIIQLVNLKQVGVVLRAYAEEHGGRFPNHISELPPYSVPPVMRQFHDPATQEARDWLYYSGRTLDDPPEMILAASPVTVYKQKRIVMSVDTVTTITAEAEFQQRLTAPPSSK